MPFRFELHTERPILEFQITAPVSADEIPRMADQATAELGRLARPVYYVVKMGDMRLSLGDIILAARHAAQGISPPLHHMNIIENIMVTTDPMIAMAARSADSYLFGNLHFRIFDALDEALRYVDDQRQGNDS